MSETQNGHLSLMWNVAESIVRVGETILRILDVLSQIYDLIVNWRLNVSILFCIGLAFLALRIGMPVDSGDFVVAALIGLVIGAIWEFISAVGQRGYI